jgi:hypothetical protein
VEDAQRSATAFAGFGSARLITPEGCRLRIDIAFPVMPMFSGLAVVDTSGAIVCSSAPPREGPESDVADRPWFRRLLATRAFTIRAPLIEPGTERAVIVFSAPVFDRAGTLTGAAYGRLPLTDLSELLRGSLTADMAFATISDTTGLIVSRAATTPKRGKASSWGRRTIRPWAAGRTGRFCRVPISRVGFASSAESIWSDTDGASTRG